MFLAPLQMSFFIIFFLLLFPLFICSASDTQALLLFLRLNRHVSLRALAFAGTSAR